jgi:riboflavin-specific deaminase-like protein
MSVAFKEFLNSRAEDSVILTFAISIDGIIGKKDEILVLSSQESLIMTHSIRNYADAIIVGIGTVLNDNPSLTTRMVQDPVDARVVIVDPFLRCPLDAKFMPRNPVLLVCNECDESKIEQYASKGAKIIKVPSHSNSSRLDLNFSIKELRKLGLKKIMIEGKSGLSLGGAEIIKECLSGRVNIDTVIATIAPIFVGSGISLASASNQLSTILKNVRYEQYGPDMVVIGEP